MPTPANEKDRSGIDRNVGLARKPFELGLKSSPVIDNGQVRVVRGATPIRIKDSLSLLHSTDENKSKKKAA